MKQAVFSSKPALRDLDILRKFLRNCMCVQLFLHVTFVCAVHPGIRQRVLAGWQVFDNYCRERVEEGKCAWACPLHRHTTGVCSHQSRTRERHRQGQGREREWGWDFALAGSAVWVVHLGECVWEGPVVGDCLGVFLWVQYVMVCLS